MVINQSPICQNNKLNANASGEKGAYDVNAVFLREVFAVCK